MVLGLKIILRIAGGVIVRADHDRAGVGVLGDVEDEVALVRAVLAVGGNGIAEALAIGPVDVQIDFHRGLEALAEIGPIGVKTRERAG